MFMTSEEYERKSLRTINNVAALAREEGIKMTRDSDGCDELPDDDALRDPTLENGERTRRIADAQHALQLDAGASRRRHGVQTTPFTMRTRLLSTDSRRSYRPRASATRTFTI